MLHVRVDDKRKAAAAEKLADVGVIEKESGMRDKGHRNLKRQVVRTGQSGVRGGPACQECVAGGFHLFRVEFTMAGPWT